MRRAYTIVAWTLAAIATVAVLLLWFTPPREARVETWRDAIDADYV